MKKVKIGFAPTRRSIFSAPDAVKYADLTRKKLTEMGVEFVDITDINPEGLFYDEADRQAIFDKFRREGVKGGGYFFRTVILVRNMSVPGWQGTLTFRCCCGGRGMSARTRMGSACGTASAGCLRRVRC